jgi:hypothetical protein
VPLPFEVDDHLIVWLKRFDFDAVRETLTMLEGLKQRGWMRWRRLILGGGVPPETLLDFKRHGDE